MSGPTSLEVAGSPDRCRETARQLRRLGRELDKAADVLTRVRATSQDAWQGKVGDLFRSRLASRINRLDQVAGQVNALANALDNLASSLERTRTEMMRATEIARAGGVPVAGRQLPAYSSLQLTPDQEAAHDHATAVAVRAAEALDAAQRGFRRTLTEVVSELTPEPARRLAPPSTADKLGEKLRNGIEDLDLSDVGDFYRDHVVPTIEQAPVRALAPGLPTLLDDLGLPPLEELLERPGLNLLKGGPPRLFGSGDPLSNPFSTDTPLLALGQAAVEQFKDDSDVDTGDRLLRSAVAGAAAGGGMAGGLALCTRANLPMPAVQLCGEGGRRVGVWGGHQALEELR